MDQKRTFRSFTGRHAGRIGLLITVTMIGFGCAQFQHRPPENPRYNLTDSPYWTDGLRVVFVFSEEPTALNELEFFDWKRLYQKYE